MSPNFVRAIELEMQRQAVVSLIVLIVVFAIVMWITYHVLRAAIRDGIRESGLLDQRRPTWQQTVTTAREKGPDTLPDMRAER